MTGIDPLRSLAAQCIKALPIGDWGMFIVKRVLKRGWFHDKVLIAATQDVSLERKRLGWDVLQAPDIQMEILRVSTGDELVVSLAKNSVVEGQSISEEQVTGLAGFNRLWRRAAA